MPKLAQGAFYRLQVAGGHSATAKQSRSMKPPEGHTPTLETHRLQLSGTE
ncbi:hypothetical protein [Microbulbifer yueqingensis]|nr:hypothetical protein [Microbulbifer yueqingensis]